MMIEVVGIVTDTKTAAAVVDLEVVVEHLEAEVKKNQYNFI